MGMLRAMCVLLVVGLGCAKGAAEPPLGSSPGLGPDGSAGEEDDACVCISGTCCDGCNFMPATVPCGPEPVDTEYQCDGDTCGADAMVRQLVHNCDGVSPECGTSNPVWQEWQVLEDCGADAVCDSDGASASCTTCAGGCSQGECTCSQGANVATSAVAAINRGSTATATYGPQHINDGLGEASCNFTWFYDGAPDVGSVELSWSAPVTLWGFTLDTVSTSSAPCQYSSGRTLAGGSIEWWDGSGWVLDQTISGQSDDWNHQFATPVTTTRVRIHQAYASPSVNPVVFEWQTFECAN